MHVDGASWSSESGVGLLLESPAGEQLEQSIRMRFPASNNETEYEAILSGLGLANALKASKVKVQSNSQLIVGQIRIRGQRRTHGQVFAKSTRIFEPARGVGH